MADNVNESMEQLIGEPIPPNEQAEIRDSEVEELVGSSPRPTEGGSAVTSTESNDSSQNLSSDFETLIRCASRMMEMVWPNCNAWAQSICGTDWQACGEQLLTPDAMMDFEEIAGRNGGVEEDVICRAVTDFIALRMAKTVAGAEVFHDSFIMQPLKPSRSATKIDKWQKAIIRLSEPCVWEYIIQRVYNEWWQAGEISSRPKSTVSRWVYAFSEDTRDIRQRAEDHEGFVRWQIAVDEGRAVVVSKKRIKIADPPPTVREEELAPPAPKQRPPADRRPQADRTPPAEQQQDRRTITANVIRTTDIDEVLDKLERTRAAKTKAEKDKVLKQAALLRRRYEEDPDHIGREWLLLRAELLEQQANYTAKMKVQLGKNYRPPPPGDNQEHYVWGTRVPQTQEQEEEAAAAAEEATQPAHVLRPRDRTRKRSAAPKEPPASANSSSSAPSTDDPARPEGVPKRWDHSLTAPEQKAFQGYRRQKIAKGGLSIANENLPTVAEQPSPTFGDTEVIEEGPVEDATNVRYRDNADLLVQSPFVRTEEPPPSLTLNEYFSGPGYNVAELVRLTGIRTPGDTRLQIFDQLRELYIELAPSWSDEALILAREGFERAGEKILGALVDEDVCWYGVIDYIAELKDELAHNRTRTPAELKAFEERRKQAAKMHPVHERMQRTIDERQYYNEAAANLRRRLSNREQENARLRQEIEDLRERAERDRRQVEELCRQGLNNTGDVTSLMVAPWRQLQAAVKEQKQHATRHPVQTDLVQADEQAARVTERPPSPPPPPQRPHYTDIAREQERSRGQGSSRDPGRSSHDHRRSPPRDTQPPQHVPRDPKSQQRATRDVQPQPHTPRDTQQRPRVHGLAEYRTSTPEQAPAQPARQRGQSRASSRHSRGGGRGRRQHKPWSQRSKRVQRAVSNNARPTAVVTPTRLRFTHHLAGPLTSLELSIQSLNGDRAFHPLSFAFLRTLTIAEVSALRQSIALIRTEIDRRVPSQFEINDTDLFDNTVEPPQQNEPPPPYTWAGPLTPEPTQHHSSEPSSRASTPDPYYDDWGSVDELQLAPVAYYPRSGTAQLPPYDRRTVQSEIDRNLCSATRRSYLLELRTLLLEDDRAQDLLISGRGNVDIWTRDDHLHSEENKAAFVERVEWSTIQLSNLNRQLDHEASTHNYTNHATRTSLPVCEHEVNSAYEKLLKLYGLSLLADNLRACQTDARLQLLKPLSVKAFVPLGHPLQQRLCANATNAAIKSIDEAARLVNGISTSLKAIATQLLKQRETPKPTDAYLKHLKIITEAGQLLGVHLTTASINLKQQDLPTKHCNGFDLVKVPEAVTDCIELPEVR